MKETCRLKKIFWKCSQIIYSFLHPSPAKESSSRKSLYLWHGALFVFILKEPSSFGNYWCQQSALVGNTALAVLWRCIGNLGSAEVLVTLEHSHLYLCCFFPSVESSVVCQSFKRSLKNLLKKLVAREQLSLLKKIKTRARSWTFHEKMLGIVTLLFGVAGTVRIGCYECLGWGGNARKVHNQYVSVGNSSETTKMRQFMILLVNYNSAIELGFFFGFILFGIF